MKAQFKTGVSKIDKRQELRRISDVFSHLRFVLKSVLLDIDTLKGSPILP